MQCYAKGIEYRCSCGIAITLKNYNVVVCQRHASVSVDVVRSSCLLKSQEHFHLFLMLKIDEKLSGK